MLIKNKTSSRVIQMFFAKSTFAAANSVRVVCSDFAFFIISHLTDEYASRIILFTQNKRAGGFLPSPYIFFKDGDLSGKFSHS